MARMIPDSPWGRFLGLLLIFGLGQLLYVGVVNPQVLVHRGHYVIDSGPYRFVRHPGYVGLLAWIFSFPPLLASERAFIPAAVTIVAVVVRTALEDRTLHAKLPGYADYATRVRFRLVPGLW